MSTETNPSPSAETVKRFALQLSPLLIRAGLNVAVGRDGVIEARNPSDGRMRQPLVLREHDGALWWHWLWSGPTREAPPEYEPMVVATDLEEAARRIANVLAIVNA